MIQTADALGLHLPPQLTFKTQASGEDSSIPDLAALDPEGREVLLIENKFWAGLTRNQPAAYLARLPQNQDGLLLFVVPQRRLHSVWPDLVTSAAAEGVMIPPRHCRWGAPACRTHRPACSGRHFLAGAVGPHGRRRKACG